MKYYIEVFYKNKLLFRTSEESCDSMDQLVNLYTILLSRLPESAGFELDATAFCKTYFRMDKKEFKEAIQKGRGKGFLMRIKNAHRKSAHMAYMLFKDLFDGLI